MARLSIQQHANVEAARSHYLAEVDGAVPGPLPSVVAMREAKWQEAKAGGGPLLRAEANALGVSLQAAIDSVTAARRRWCDAEAAREAERIRAKHRIRQAETPAEMHHAFNDYQAALEAAFSV